MKKKKKKLFPLKKKKTYLKKVVKISLIKN